MKLKRLQDARAAKIKEMRSISNAAESNENGLLTAEQTQKYDALKAEVDALDAEITREQALMEAERNLAPAAGNTPSHLNEQDKAAANGGRAPAGSITVRDNANPKPFATFADQLSAIVRAGSPGGSVDPRLQQLNQIGAGPAGASEGVPSDGGFLVQQDHAQEIITRVYEIGQIASRVRRVPVGANSNGLKVNAVDETSRANGSRFGGVQVFWEGEGDSPAAKKPKFRLMELKLSKLIGLMYATEELLADFSALDAIAKQAFADEVNFMVEASILEGTGAGQPKGVWNSGAFISVAKETGQAGQTIVLDNINKMYSRCWARSRQNAVWLINQDCEPQLDKLSLPVGTGGVPVYLPPNGAAGDRLHTLKGLPVIPVEHAKTCGTVGDISLVDLSQYLMIDKGGIKQDVSMHVRFIYDEMAFRITYRVDGQPIWDAPLTPKNGSNTLSPFVGLATRA